MNDFGDTIKLMKGANKMKALTSDEKQTPTEKTA